MLYILIKLKFIKQTLIIHRISQHGIISFKNIIFVYFKTIFLEQHLNIRFCKDYKLSFIKVGLTLFKKYTTTV